MLKFLEQAFVQNYDPSVIHLVDIEVEVHGPIIETRLKSFNLFS